jgi:3-isopropylmalate dehydratase small subunit
MENNKKIVSEETYCRSCGARIAFITSQKTGKHIPVDLPPKRVKPSDSGKYVFENGQFLNAACLSEDNWGYTCHFATCKDATKWRKKEKNK